MKEKPIEQHKLVVQLLEALRTAKEPLLDEACDDRGSLAEVISAIEVGEKAPTLMEVGEALSFASDREAEGYSSGWRTSHAHAVSAVLRRCTALLEEACDETEPDSNGYDAGYDSGFKAGRAYGSIKPITQEDAAGGAEEAREAGCATINIATCRGEIIQVDGMPDGYEYTVHDVDQEVL